MKSGDALASEDAEQRIENAVDAIRGMSRDLADEVTPQRSRSSGTMTRLTTRRGSTRSPSCGSGPRERATAINTSRRSRLRSTSMQRKR
jgi:hypothetical protein